MPNFLQEDYGIRQSMADTAAPGSGTFNVFDFVWNSSPALASPLGWVCTAGGTPGTWAQVGNPQNVTSVAANTAGAAVPVTANIVSITGSGGYNLTLAAPTAAQAGTRIAFVNASSGTVTLTAASGTVLVAGVATILTNVNAEVVSSGTSWYRVG